MGLGVDCTKDLSFLIEGFGKVWMVNVKVKSKLREKIIGIIAT